MKKIVLMLVCAMICMSGYAQKTKLTAESKAAIKKDLKTFDGWKGAGADADVKKALERCYGYIQDTVNYVWAQAAVQDFDGKAAIDKATPIAQKKALDKAKQVLRARGERISNIGEESFPILTLYKNEKKKTDGAKAMVRVAIKITK